MNNLGLQYASLGRYAEALDHLNTLGETLLAMHRPAEARAQHESALALGRELGERHEEARALDGLAHAMQVLGRLAEARTHWQQAYGIYREHGAPEAAKLRAKL